MTKCPLSRGVRLREVSVSGGSTVYQNWAIVPQTVWRELSHFAHSGSQISLM